MKTKLLMAPTGALQLLTQRYDAAAAHWHRRLQRLGVVDAYAALFDRLLCECVLSPPDAHTRVLDAGVGTGAFAGALLRQGQPIAQLAAIDISACMLMQAQCQLRGRAASIDLRMGSIGALPWANDQFDLVLAAHVLEHVEDCAGALAEFARVLIPGGLLILCITQPCLLDLLNRLRWRHQRLKPDVLCELLRHAGLGLVWSGELVLRNPLCAHGGLCLVARQSDTFA